MRSVYPVFQENVNHKAVWLQGNRIRKHNEERNERQASNPVLAGNIEHG